MKIKKDFDLEKLLDYGFTKVDKQEAQDNDEYYIASADYQFEIGHARRGQFYYLLISQEYRNVIIYSTDPDGSGGSITCPDVLVKMSLDGVFEF